MNTDPEILFRVAATVLGACVGSFLNVVVYRLPIDELSIWKPRRSFCPQCKSPIGWFDNIPILSWLLLMARCRQCRKPIPIRYPLVEAVTAASFLLVTLVFGFDQLATSIFYMILMAGLVVITFVDIDHRIIPDQISVTWAMFIPLAALFLEHVPVEDELVGFIGDRIESLRVASVPESVPVLLALPAALLCMWLMRKYTLAEDGGQRAWYETRLAGAAGFAAGYALAGIFLVEGWLVPGSGNEALVISLLGMATGAGAIYGVGVFGSKLFKQDAMGFGDVKLMGLLGGVLGPQDVLLAIFLACIFGSVVGVVFKLVTRDPYIPFGPFLALGSVFMILAGDRVYSAIRGYLDLSSRTDPRIVLAITGTFMVGMILLLLHFRKQRLRGDEPTRENH